MQWVVWVVILDGVAICALLAYVANRMDKRLAAVRDHLETLIAENRNETAVLSEVRDHLSKIVYCSENAPWIAELREAGELPAPRKVAPF